ncbi:hypothetical protein DW079_11630 [Segatella copri]|uniref:Uncharacterized protein n=1 Tax=Segatella copri TaxID=165179 RepID=A0A3R6MCS6_9BACT|nr:hypothetical protein DW079_11630 [Segatella copri]
MLFNCKDNSFFSIMESFLIFFCIFACKFKGICRNRARKSPIWGWKIPKSRISDTCRQMNCRQQMMKAQAYTLIYITEEIKNKINRKKQYG